MSMILTRRKEGSKDEQQLQLTQGVLMVGQDAGCQAE